VSSSVNAAWFIDQTAKCWEIVRTLARQIELRALASVALQLNPFMLVCQSTAAAQHISWPMSTQETHHSTKTALSKLKRLATATAINVMWRAQGGVLV
jgi:hypothetical protein